jgi:hypothetical protein
MPLDSGSTGMERRASFFRKEEELSGPLQVVGPDSLSKEKVIMNTQRPVQTAPVARNLVGNQTDLLAELSEETLVGVAPSVSVTVTCVSATVTCAYSGQAD